MNHEDFLKQMYQWERDLELRLENQKPADEPLQSAGKDIIGCIEIEIFLREMAKAETHH